MSAGNDLVGVGLYLVPLELGRGFHIKGAAAAPALSLTLIRFASHALPQASSPAALRNAPVRCTLKTY